MLWTTIDGKPKRRRITAYVECEGCSHEVSEDYVESLLKVTLKMNRLIQPEEVSVRVCREATWSEVIVRWLTGRRA
jgi:hypothetical protein